MSGILASLFHSLYLKQESYICFMTKPKTSLSIVNYITGISDGMLLPIIPCTLTTLFWGNTSREAFIWFNLATCVGALAYGFARFIGEKEEIKHNHPDITKQELLQDERRLKHIGIDEGIVNDMMKQVEQEQDLWLKEVRENDLGWEHLDLRRAQKSGIQTGCGFLAGAYIVALPFLLFSLNANTIVPFILTEFGLMFLFGWIKGKYIYNSPLRSAAFQLLKGVLIFLILALLLAISMSWWTP
jgi:VIT1/CCC1 family predicted Fe2+/Mn2+ transporter